MLRKVLIWIVVALLPLQGYAAAAMISCGPMHARMSLVAAPAGAADHHSHAAHSHAGEHQAAYAHGHDEPAPAADETATADLSNLKCSACASCCTAPVGPTSALIVVAGMPGHAEAIPFFPASEDSIVPDGFERPPRQHLA